MAVGASDQAAANLAEWAAKYAAAKLPVLPHRLRAQRRQAPAHAPRQGRRHHRLAAGHRAASLRRQHWSYTRIAEYLGYPDRRAAHRGVQRALAEPAAEEAQLRGLRTYEASERLLDVQRHLFVLLELHRPLDPVADHRAWFRIFDTLFRVTDQRCRLHGLYTHPWRYDLWSRRDIPLLVRVQLEWRAAQLGREACVPVRWRAAKRIPSSEPVSVVSLRPVEALPVDVDSLAPASVRRLLDQLAA